MPLALWGGTWSRKSAYIAAHIEAVTEAGTGVFVRPSGVVHTRGQRWQLEELSLRWEELRGEKRYGGKQKLACRLVAMADAAGDDVIHEDEQLHERREAAAAAKAATAERRRASHRTRRRLQAVAMDIAEESSDEEAGIEDGEKPDGHTRVSKRNVVETTALGTRKCTQNQVLTGPNWIWGRSRSLLVLGFGFGSGYICWIWFWVLFMGWVWLCGHR